MNEIFSGCINYYLLLTLILALSILYVYWERRSKLLHEHKELIKELNSKDKELDELKSAQEEKKSHLESSKIKSENVNFTDEKLLNIVAHDVKGPLKYMTNLAMLVKENYSHLSDEERLENLELISKTGNKINELFQNIIQWKKMQLDTFVMQREMISLKELVQDNIGLYLSGAKVKGVSITNEVDDSVYVWGDATMLSVVFQNLISNALKFTNNGGVVKIYTTPKEDDVVEVSVSDTGIGMTESEVEKMLNNNFFFTKLGTSEELGTGFGMMIVQEMISLHQSELSVDSTIGKGTRFSFVLHAVN